MSKLAIFNNFNVMEAVNLRKAALIVVDVQNDFVDGSLSILDAPAKQNPYEIIEPINNLIDRDLFGLVICTKDWHPEAHISFLASVTNDDRMVSAESTKPKYDLYDEVEFIHPVKTKQVLYPSHCVMKTEGAELYSKLRSKNAQIVYKGYNTFCDSYSAFFDNNKSNETELNNILRQANIDTVFVCGLAHEYCVKFTALDASELGFKTFMLTDCTRGLNEELMIKADKELAQSGVIQIDSKLLF
uniref:Isochorismatase domain-containing protein n=1 Tax=Rhabditophanes sp. KR3021 TaxID=114890 RepID=A0AC35UHS2_9BILA